MHATGCLVLPAYMSAIERRSDLGGNLIKEITKGAFRGLTLAADDSYWGVTL